MSSDFAAGMADATQMTRDGRLGEATALIQRLLGGSPAASAPSAVTPLRLARTPQAPEPDRSSAPSGATPKTRRAGLRDTVRRLAERARALDVPLADVEAPRPAGARFEAGLHAEPAGARAFKLYVPASAPPAGERALVLMLHGCTQNPDDFALGTGMNAAAEATGVLIAYPAQPGAANANKCWNWFRPEDQRRAAGEPSVLAGLVRRVVAEEGVDPARVFVAGLSAGGAAAAILGAEYPDLFAAVGVHSGLPHGAASDLGSALAAMRQGARGAPASRPVRTIVFHGDADRVVNPANAAAIAAQATAPAGPLSQRVVRGSAGGRAFSRTLHDDADGRTLCEHWTIHGAGHAWAGGDAAGSHADPLGPDASREMLRFFLES